jgi:hypothetical protein
MTTLKVEIHKHGMRQVVLSIAGTVCALVVGLSIGGLQLLGQGGGGANAGVAESLPRSAAITRPVEPVVVSDQEMYSRYRAAAERHAAELGLVSDQEMYQRLQVTPANGTEPAG